MEQHHSPVRDDLTLLPVEVLVKILTYLRPKDVFSNISLVCKKFRDVVSGHGEVLWSHISIHDDMNLDAARRWIQVSSRCLRGLTISRSGVKDGDQKGSNDIATTALQSCPRLQCLSCSGFQVMPDVLNVLGDRGMSFRRLSLGHANLNTPAFRNVLANLRNLTSFSSSCIGDESLKVLVDHCQKIQKLDILDKDISDEAWSYCLERVRTTVTVLKIFYFSYHKVSFGWIERCTRLEELVLGNIRRWSTLPFMSISKLSNLKSLELDFYVGVSNHSTPGAKYIFNNGGPKSLVTLHLREYLFLTQEDLDTIASNGKNLRCLGLSYCAPVYASDKQGLKSILEHCTRLRTLAVCGLKLNSRDFRDARASLRNLHYDRKMVSVETLQEIRSCMPILDVISMHRDREHGIFWADDYLPVRYVTLNRI